MKNRREKEIALAFKKVGKKATGLEIHLQKQCGNKVWEKCRFRVTNLGTNQSKPQRIGIHSESDGKKLARNKEKEVRNEVIREKSGVEDLGYRIRKTKWRYAGHIEKEKLRSGFQEAKKDTGEGRTIRRWNDEFKREVEPLWIRLARNRRAWKVCGEAYVLKRAGTAGKEERILIELHQ